MKLNKILNIFFIIIVLFFINGFIYAENNDEYSRRFTALEIANNTIKNSTSVRIKGFGNGNRILIEILNGKLKGEKGYINLKGFKEINDKFLEKYIGTTWGALAIHESAWIDAEPEDIDMSKYDWEYGIVLFSIKYLKNDNFENRLLNSLNLILIKEKMELNDKITQYDCERNSSKIFLYNFNDDIYGLLQESGIPKDYVFCKGYFWNE
nr:hypothetical protein [uncultured Leptotrichia sp.]